MTATLRVTTSISKTAIAISPVCLAEAAMASPFDGTWSITGNNAGARVAFSIKTDGSNFTGTSKDVYGSSHPINGAIRNGRLEWNEFGGGMVVVYSGTINGDKMTINAYMTGRNGPTTIIAKRVSH